MKYLLEALRYWDFKQNLEALEDPKLHSIGQKAVAVRETDCSSLQNPIIS